MMLIKDSNLLIAALAVLLTAAFISGCGTLGGNAPPNYTVSSVSVTPYLAPGASATFPSTIRVHVRVEDAILPIISAAIDPDGDGESQSIPVSMQLIGKLDPLDTGTYYYFDFVWEGPDNTRSETRVITASGSYRANFTLQLDLLTAWPY
jgi:hypothetical protein